MKTSDIIGKLPNNWFPPERSEGGNQAVKTDSPFGRAAYRRIIYGENMIISSRPKYLLFMILLLMIGLANAEENSWTRVNGGTWRPSEQILSKIKMNLEPYMKSQEKVFARSLEKWNTYHFQYQGQEENSRKIVYINAFCNLYSPNGLNLTNNSVIVDDGRGCFFQLKYDPIKDIYFDAFINGEG